MEDVPIDRLRFYAQHGEDCLLWQLFERRPTGTYIDVGAFDGIYLSNTFSFYQQGWRGACIEPHPHYYKLLQRNRPEDLCVHAVCGTTHGGSVEFKTELLGLYSTASSDDGVAQGIAARYEKNAVHFAGLKAVVVPQVNLEQVAADHFGANSRIDLVTIDVEGFELEVLAGLGSLRPRVLIIEENTAQMSERILARANELGYTLARKIGVNGVYTLEARDAIRVREVQVRCAIEKALHPLGREYTLPEYRNGHIIDEQASQTARALSETRSSADRLARQVQNLSTRIDELERARRSDAAAARDNAARAEELSHSLEVSIKEIARLRLRIDELEREKSRQASSLKTTERALHRFQARKDELEHRVALITTHAAELARDLEAARTRIAEMTSAYRLGFAVRHPWRAIRGANEPGSTTEGA